MVDMADVEETIAKLEQESTSFAVCEKLASLYIVRDHNGAQDADGGEPQTAPQVGGSEFLRAAAGVEVPKLLKMFDDHMEAMRAVYPREYDAMMRRLLAL